jgi:hypothetical protein
MGKRSVVERERVIEREREGDGRKPDAGGERDRPDLTERERERGRCRRR